MPMDIALHRYSVERYERMAEAGLLPERGIELIDGLVVDMSPKGARHAYAVSKIAACLNDHRMLGYMVFPESLSLRLGPGDEVDPDIALATETRSFATERPTVDEIALIIEVSDSSLSFDLGVKRKRYAAAGLVEYWVADLQKNVVHQFWNPFADDYEEHRIVAGTDTISPRAFPEAAVELSIVFGLSSAVDSEENGG